MTKGELLVVLQETRDWLHSLYELYGNLRAPVKTAIGIKSKSLAEMAKQTSKLTGRLKHECD